MTSSERVACGADSEMSASGDLTSLSWLHNLNIMDNISGAAAPPTPPASPLPGAPNGEAGVGAAAHAALAAATHAARGHGHVGARDGRHHGVKRTASSAAAAAARVEPVRPFGVPIKRSIQIHLLLMARKKCST